MRKIICFIIGHKYKLIHSGAWEWENPKHNGGIKVFKGYGKIYRCSSCGRERLKR
jgi:hypothetical protein